MKTTISINDFISAFALSQYKDNFSRAALVAIFTDICETEAATDTEIELDVCAISCEWSEYGSIAEYMEDHNLDYEDVNIDKAEAGAQLAEYGELDPDQEEAFMDWLREQTTVIKLDNCGLVVVDY